jgi:hypothetical protein
MVNYKEDTNKGTIKAKDMVTIMAEGKNQTHSGVKR